MVTDLPGIDFDAGLRYANGRIANYRRILRLFNDTHGKEFAGRMHSAMERDNWEEASRQAHSFKSAARTIGADHLGRLGKELEDACLARQAEYAEKILGRLEIELRIVCAGLEALPGD